VPSSIQRRPKYSTTVIGAYSVSDWYEALDRLVAVGQLSMASMADAQYRCMQAAILDQELAGIDVITGGEMHRRTHNRHSPPNAMLNYFWQKIPALPGPVGSEESEDLPAPRSKRPRAPRARGRIALGLPTSGAARHAA
jgi:hypothetical protein